MDTLHVVSQHKVISCFQVVLWFLWCKHFASHVYTISDFWLQNKVKGSTNITWI